MNYNFNLFLFITRIVIFGLLIVASFVDYRSQELRKRQIESQQEHIRILEQRLGRKV